jgi:hypothetical protein
MFDFLKRTLNRYVKKSHFFDIFSKKRSLEVSLKALGMELERVFHKNI